MYVVPSIAVEVLPKTEFVTLTTAVNNKSPDLNDELHITRSTQTRRKSVFSKVQFEIRILLKYSVLNKHPIIRELYTKSLSLYRFIVSQDEDGYSVIVVKL